MKKQKYLLFLPAMLVAGALLFQACEKDEGSTTSENTEVIQDDALSSEMFDDAFNETDQALQNYFGGQKSMEKNRCRTLTWQLIDPETRIFTINFGDGSCNDSLGRAKRGKIIITTTGTYRNQGFTRTITFEDYFINDYQVEGTKTVVNQGTNDSGQVIFDVTLEGGKVTTPGGKEITKSYERTRTWSKGADTKWWIWDDEYLISGTATGTNRKGVNYTRTITTPLHIATTCRFIKSGSIEFNRENEELIVVDYGNGECDALATITVGDGSKEIKLRK